VFWSSVCFLPIFAWVIENSTFNMAVWGHSYLVALCGSTVFMVLEHKGAPQLTFLRSGPAAFFARISYALYLTHTYVVILVFLAAKSSPTVVTLQGAALTILAFAISIAICIASYRFIEEPLIRMAHRKFNFGKPRNSGNDLLPVSVVRTLNAE
jgi:peptidoglycan/LPS O-acetylase OafA/YrhL